MLNRETCCKADGSYPGSSSFPYPSSRLASLEALHIKLESDGDVNLVCFIISALQCAIRTDVD